MLGSRIGQLLSKKFKIVAPPHSHLDLTNKKKVWQNITDVLPDQIVYAAGITKVDTAQTHPREAFRVNAKAPGIIAQKAAQLNIPFHYISTDAVFDGKQKNRPYKENDKTNPLSVYGKSKLLGEKATLTASPRNSVIRTIMIYSAFYPHKKDFARLTYETLKSKEEFLGIVDQVINPTFVDDLVCAIEAILIKKKSGIYHVAARDYTTNYGFVTKIAKAFKLDKHKIAKQSFADFMKGKKAPRARYCHLDTSKFQKEIDKNILKTIDQSINVFKRQIEKQGPSPVSL